MAYKTGKGSWLPADFDSNPGFLDLYKVCSSPLKCATRLSFGWIHDLSAPDPTNIFTLFGLIPVDTAQLYVVWRGR